MELQLHFGTHRVGALSRVYDSDFNWYGTFQPAAEMPPRLRDFIAFCKEWHQRLDAGRPHNAAEFDAWRDIHGSGEWQTVASDGTVKWITGPVFWPDGTIVWREAKKGVPDPAADQPSD